MKKLIILLFVLILMGCPKPIIQDKITITWDAPTKYTNGNPILEDTVIAYEVYVRKSVDRIAVFIEMVEYPPYDLIFPNRGCYDVGVLAVCDNQKSAMNWSNENKYNQEIWEYCL